MNDSQYTEAELGAFFMLLNKKLPTFKQYTTDLLALYELGFAAEKLEQITDYLIKQYIIISDFNSNVVFINQLLKERLKTDEKLEKNIVLFLEKNIVQLYLAEENTNEPYNKKSYKITVESDDKNDFLWITSCTIHINDTKDFLLTIINDPKTNTDGDVQLKNAHDKLEALVEKRTQELTITNYHLTNEIKERNNIEYALRKSEKRFKDLFYSSPEAIYVEDFSGIILNLNDAAAIMHGVNREDLIGVNFKDLLPEIESDDTIEDRQQKIMSGGLNYFESYIKRANGDIIPIAVKSAVIEYKDDLAILLYSRDISERFNHQKMLENMNIELESKIKDRTYQLENEVQIRKLIETKIKKQKDFLHLVIDSNPSLYFVYDKNGKYKLVNKSFADYFGKTIHHILNNETIYTLPFSSDFKFPLPNEFKSKAKTFETNILNPITNKHNYFKIELTYLQDKRSDEIEILVIANDLTEAKEVEKKLIESENLYRTIAGNVPDTAIFIFDVNLVVRLAEGPLVGIVSPPKNEMEGKHVLETTPDELKTLRKEFYEKIINEEFSGIQLFYENEKHLLVNAIPIYDLEGKVIYGMVLVMDITNLKKAEVELLEKATKLEQSNEELERFAYVASHDLQSPLRTITSYLQILDTKLSTVLDDSSKELFTFAVDGAKRMQNLITDLLDYSRINSVSRPFVEIDMNAIVLVATKNLETTITEKKAIIQSEKLPTIIAEPYKLAQLLQNLIDNAIKFVEDKQPFVQISYTESEDYWQFAVADNGIGIKEEFKEKIFLIFQRLHTDSQYEGTGIGLAICKKVIQLHHGNIWFESSQNGTTFYFTISKKL